MGFSYFMFLNQKDDHVKSRRGSWLPHDTDYTEEGGDAASLSQSWIKIACVSFFTHAQKEIKQMQSVKAL